jgi:DNA-binding IclR family transcriptional regulator
VLENLTEKTSESSHIGIVEGNEIIYLQKVECKNPIRLFTHIGKRNPIHCSGTGQVILAYQSESLIEEFLSQELRSFTRYSITNSYLLKEKLRQIKEQGYAIIDSELHDDIISIASPIFNGKNDVIAAINIAGPVNRIKSTKKIYLDAVLKAGRDLSMQVISRTR